MGLRLLSRAIFRSLAFHQSQSDFDEENHTPRGIRMKSFVKFNISPFQSFSSLCQTRAATFDNSSWSAACKGTKQSHEHQLYSLPLKSKAVNIINPKMSKKDFQIPRSHNRLFGRFRGQIIFSL